MRKHLYVDGTDLASFGVYVSGQGTFAAPEKDVTTYSVPGRNGLILGVNERMENINVTYPCFIYTNFDQNLRGLRSFLLSKSGYIKINDDYDTTHFRMGFFEAGIDPEVTSKNDAGQFDLTFNCQPQRWLNSGAVVVTKTSSIVKSDTNPTLFDAKPLIVIEGLTPNTNQDISLTTIIGGSGTGTIHVYKPDTMNSDNLTIDVQSQQCTYLNSSNKVVSANQYISTQEYQGAYGVDFPSIPAGGQLSVSVSSYPTITVSFTHRWWEV